MKTLKEKLIEFSFTILKIAAFVITYVLILKFMNFEAAVFFGFITLIGFSK